MNSVNREKTIRILHYIGSLELGGSQTFVMELYRNIDRRCVQFDFVTFPNERGPLYEEIVKLGGKVFECPKYNGINHFAFKKWWDIFLLNHQEYEVVHGHVRSVASIYLPIVRKHKRYSIIHSHSASNGKGLLAIVKFFLQLPIRYQADYYMACSIKAGKWLFGKKVISSSKYSTVPNAINADKYSFNPETRKLVRQEYGIDEFFCIGHVGRFTKVKNHEFLLRVLQEIVKTEDRVRLLLVGDGPLRAIIETRAEEMGLSDKIIFAGPRSDTDRFYQAMDVFAFPSLWEGLGIVSIEAQASGLPCIVSTEVPIEADIGVGLFNQLSTEDTIAWAEKMMSLRKDICNRRGFALEVKKSGYDIGENAIKMQTFYLKKSGYEL